MATLARADDDGRIYAFKTQIASLAADTPFQIIFSGSEKGRAVMQQEQRLVALPEASYVCTKNSGQLFTLPGLTIISQSQNEAVVIVDQLPEAGLPLADCPWFDQGQWSAEWLPDSGFVIETKTVSHSFAREIPVNSTSLLPGFGASTKTKPELFGLGCYGWPYDDNKKKRPGFGVAVSESEPGITITMASLPGFDEQPVSDPELRVVITFYDDTGRKHQLAYNLGQAELRSLVGHHKELTHISQIMPWLQKQTSGQMELVGRIMAVQDWLDTWLVNNEALSFREQGGWLILQEKLREQLAGVLESSGSGFDFELELSFLNIQLEQSGFPPIIQAGRGQKKTIDTPIISRESQGTSKNAGAKRTLSAGASGYRPKEDEDGEGTPPHKAFASPCTFCKQRPVVPSETLCQRCKTEGAATKYQKKFLLPYGERAAVDWVRTLIETMEQAGKQPGDQDINSLLRAFGIEESDKRQDLETHWMAVQAWRLVAVIRDGKSHPNESQMSKWLDQLHQRNYESFMKLKFTLMESQIIRVISFAENNKKHPDEGKMQSWLSWLEHYQFGSFQDLRSRWNRIRTGQAMPIPKEEFLAGEASLAQKKHSAREKEQTHMDSSMTGSRTKKTAPETKCQVVDHIRQIIASVKDSGAHPDEGQIDDLLTKKLGNRHPEFDQLSLLWKEAQILRVLKAVEDKRHHADETHMTSWLKYLSRKGWQDSRNLSFRWYLAQILRVLQMIENEECQYNEHKVSMDSWIGWFRQLGYNTEYDTLRCRWAAAQAWQIVGRVTSGKELISVNIMKGLLKTLSQSNYDHYEWLDLYWTAAQAWQIVQFAETGEVHPQEPMMPEFIAKLKRQKKPYPSFDHLLFRWRHAHVRHGHQPK